MVWEDGKELYQVNDTWQTVKSRLQLRFFMTEKAKPKRKKYPYSNGMKKKNL